MKRRRWKGDAEIEGVEVRDVTKKEGGGNRGIDKKEVVMINAKMRMEMNT